MYFYILDTCFGAVLIAKEGLDKLIIDGKRRISNHPFNP